jgi:epoxide hydrolase-like protein
MTLEAGNRYAVLITACVVCLGSLNSLGNAQTKTSQAQPKGNAMTKTATAPPSSGKTADENAIRPFQVRIPEEALVDLRSRIAATRWPEKEPVADPSQGVQLATMQKLAHYWETGYDWRKCEAKLNALPQFVTTIDGVDIHFIHVRSKVPNALPIIITHGWPGSIVEQMKLIGPLTDPTAYGGKAEDAFDVVIPSIPGFGFSGKPTTTGWDPAHVARAWVTLMKRLGYTRFVASGSARHRQGDPDWQPATPWSLRRRASGVRAPGRPLPARPGLRPGDVDPPADDVCDRRFTRRPGRLDARSR